MKTFSHVYKYLAEFVLEWEMFRTKAVEKTRPHVLSPKTFLFPKIVPFMI
jgi:hypothetical protein